MVEDVHDDVVEEARRDCLVFHQTARKRSNQAAQLEPHIQAHVMCRPGTGVPGTYILD